MSYSSKLLALLLIGLGASACSGAKIRPEVRSGRANSDPTAAQTSEQGQPAYKLTSPKCKDPDLTKVMQGETLMLCDGSQGIGTLDSNATLASPPLCAAEGESNCVIDGTRYKAIDTNNLRAEHIVAGVSIAGITGTIAPKPENCSADGATECVAISTYPAVNRSNLAAADLKEGLTIAGITGTATILKLTSVTPAVGRSAGGNTVVIAGSGFHAGMTVAIGGIACTSIAIASATEASCSAGAHAPGSADVVVTAPNGKTLAALASGYSFSAQYPTAQKVFEFKFAPAHFAAGKVLDQSANHNDAAVAGSVVYAKDGAIDTASFPGVSRNSLEILTLNGSGWHTINDPVSFTFSFWMKPLGNGTDNGNGILSVMPSTAAALQGYGVSYYGNSSPGVFNVNWQDGIVRGGGWWNDFASAQVTSFNPSDHTYRWTHMVWAVSQTQSRLYIDGQLAQSDVLTAPLAPFDIDRILIGGNFVPGWDGNYFNGRMALVRYFSGAFTDADVADLHQEDRAQLGL
jgi:hypothetical protein